MLLQPAGPSDLPQQPNTTPWTVIGAPTAWRALNRGTSQPTQPDQSMQLSASPGTGTRETAIRVDTSDLAGTMPAVSRAWFFASTGPNTSLTLEVYCGAQHCRNTQGSDAVKTWGTVTATQGQPARWRSVSFLLSSTAALNGLQLMFTASGSPQASVFAAYVTLQVSPPGISQTLQPTPPDISNNWRINDSTKTSAAAALALGIDQPNPVDDPGWPSNPSVGISAIQSPAIADVSVASVKLEGRQVSTVTAWFYANVIPGSTLTVEAICTGCPIATTTVLGDSPFAWWSISFSPTNDPQIALNSLHLRFTATTTGAQSTATTVRAAYVNVQLLVPDYLLPTEDLPGGTWTVVPWTTPGIPALQAIAKNHTSGYLTVPALPQIHANGPNQVARMRFASVPLGGRAPLQNPPGPQSKAWFFASTGSGTTLHVDVCTCPCGDSGCATSGSTDVGPNAAPAWLAIPFTPGATQDAIDNIHMKFSTTSGSDATVRAAYVELQLSQCSPTYGQFNGTSVSPSACWRPFSDWSPLNRPLPTNAVNYVGMGTMPDDPSSTNIIGAMFRERAFAGDPPGIPADPSDPDQRPIRHLENMSAPDTGFGGQPYYFVPWATQSTCQSPGDLGCGPYLLQCSTVQEDPRTAIG
jgi:hypothetical protein